MLVFIDKNLNDIIYLSLLLFCVLIGPYYRKLDTIELKKIVGSMLGIALIIAVSGNSAAHPIMSGLMGISIIKSDTIKRCHVTTFFFMFGYLFVFRIGDQFGLQSPPGHTNLIEMIIVLRVVGVAFEMNGSWLAMSNAKKKETNVSVAESKQLPEKDDEFVELINPDFLDLFHYTFNYIGLLTGPYYRYRTFDDYFRLPFSERVDVFGFTINTLKNVPVYVSLYLAFSNLWPLEKKKIIGFIMWFLRSHSESYQAAAFLLLSFDRIWKYYSSVYHYWYGVWLAFLVTGLILSKVRAMLAPKTQRDNITEVKQ